jgi:hypothetical protein
LQIKDLNKILNEQNLFSFDKEASSSNKLRVSANKAFDKSQMAETGLL